MDTPGLIVPPLTPFTADLKVDYPALKRVVDYVVGVCRADAVSAAGVETQEYHYLSHDERKELIRRTVEFVGGRCPTIVGISTKRAATVRTKSPAPRRPVTGAHRVQTRPAG